MKRVSLIVILMLILVPAVSDATDWIGRLRVINISPNDSSSTILDTGTGVTVDSKTTVEVDLTMMLSESWGLELIAATAEHDLATSAGALGGADAGSVWVLPPTLTLQYHFRSGSSLHPYIGLGINYTMFYKYELSDDLAGLGVTDVDFDGSFGLAGDFGIDVDLGERWLLNFDVKYIQISTDASLRIEGGDTLDKVSVDVDPWVYGIGIGLRF
jgi:outer membrane protein